MDIFDAENYRNYFMYFNSDKHHRRSIRLKGYDYSQAGLYFITICVQGKVCLFGRVENNEKEGDHEGRPYEAQCPAKRMILNDVGEMVEREWLKIPNRYPNVQLHEFIIMPNHIHCIIEIKKICDDVSVGATLVVAPIHEPNHTPNQNIITSNGLGATTRVAPTVSEIIAAFKSIVTVEYIHGIKQFGWHPFDKKLWQRNYWEHIIRNSKSYENISNYIINNPVKWEIDSLYNS